jgi:hypothetical protein
MPRLPTLRGAARNDCCVQQGEEEDYEKYGKGVT